MEQKPPAKVADSTINGWLTGPSVPGPTHTRYFLALTAFLQAQAMKSASGYAARPEEWWRHLLRQAREERKSAQGGRPRGERATSTPSAGPVMIPPAPAGFTGRGTELERVLGWLDPDGESGEGTTSATVAGMAGVGKTALVLQAAHQARARGWFPGGILFIDLRGYGSDPVGPGETADRFLRALGVKTKDLPGSVAEKVDAWRLALDALARQGRPLLAVLDNGRAASQVTPLLVGAPHRVLVTSRHTLSLLPAHRVDLAPLALDEANDLLDRMLRAGGTGDGRVADQMDDALRLVELCGYLPLALRIIGALLRDEPERPLVSQVRELEDERNRLDAMEYEDDDQRRPLAVRASFELSYRHLTGPQQYVFGLLATAPGSDISTSTATALLGQSPVQTRRVLAAMARANLLNLATTSGGTLPVEERERWAMHDLIRLFAAESPIDADDRDTSVVRLLDHYLATAEAADSHLRTRTGHFVSDLFAGHHQALDWLEGERANLVAAATSSAAHHHAASTRLATVLSDFFSRRRHFEDWMTLAAKAGSIFRDTQIRPGEADMLNNLGLALRGLRRFDEAIDAHTRAADIFQETGDRHPEAAVLDNLGCDLQQVRRFDEAIDAHTRAADICREFGDPYEEAGVLTNLGNALQQVGRLDEAVEAQTRAADIFQETGDRYREGMALSNLGSVLHDLCRFDEAINVYSQSVAVARETGDHHGEGTVLNNLGNALRQVRRFDEAVDAETRAAGIFRKAGDPHGEGLALNNLGAALSDLRRFDEAIDAYARAVELAQETGDRDSESNWVSNLGLTLKQVRRFDEAIDAYARAVELAQEAGDPHEEGLALNGLGSILHAVRRFPEAVDARTRAAACFHETNDRRREGLTLLNLGGALYLSRRYEETIAIYTEAVACFQETGERIYAERTRANIRTVRLLMRRFDGGSP